MARTTRSKPPAAGKRVTRSAKQLRRDTETLEAKVKSLSRADAAKLQGVEKGRKP